jgi:peptidoglycan/LPS O-acetylase OafA/YrhL
VNGEARATQIPHVAALDGARGAAVAAVLLFHGGHLLGGYLGVDFFFVLSGFLITSLLLAESNRTGTVRLSGFWARRARRLLPALAVLMVGIAIYCLAFATPQQLAQIRGDAFATLGYVANWREIFSHKNYFALFTAPSPLNHTWSLAIEEQFYVIWPLVFVGLLAWWKRAVPKAVLVTTLALAGLSTALTFALYDRDNVSRAYFGTDTRAAAILFGAALAAWLAIHGPVTRRNARIALEAVGLVGAAVLALAWTRLDGQSSTLYRGGFLVCGLAATAVIAAAVHPQPGPISRALSLKPLCGLGLISYGVYLYHWPIDLAFDVKQMGFGGWPLLAFQTAITLIVAFASFKIVEQPIRRGALTSTQLRKLTPAIAFGLVLAIIGTTSGAHPLNVALLKHPLRAARNAYVAAPPGSKRVMIVGDSVGFFLGESFAELTTRPPLAVLDTAILGCSLLPEATSARYVNSDGNTVIQPTSPCNPRWQPGVLDRFRPDLVFLIVSNAANEWRYRNQWVGTCSEQYASLYERGLLDELALLGSHDSQVVMTTGVYPRYFGANTDTQTDCDNRVRRKVAAATGTQLIDLQGYICPTRECRVKQNGATLRPDGEHFEGAGGRLVAQWLLDQVR